MGLQEFLSLPTTMVVLYVIIFCICMMGLLGNTISVVVLTRIKWKKSVIILFMGLIFCNCLELFHQIYSNILTHTFFSDRFAMKIQALAPISLTMQSFANTGSTCLILLLSADRYLTLCRPLLARLLCTTKMASCSLAACAIVSLLMAFPTLYEHEVVRIRIFDEILGSMNMTIDVLKLEAYDMPEELIFITKAPGSNGYAYTMLVVRIILYVVLPWLGLFVFNTLVYLQIRKLYSAGAGETLNQEQQNDLSVTKTVQWFVITYFISNILALYFYFEILISDADDAMSHISLVARISELLVVFAASVNLWIFLFIGHRFRETLLNMLPARFCVRARRDDQSTLVVHMENSPGSSISFRTLTNEA